MPDYTIANQVKIPDSMATIGNMVNTARGMTALQQERALLQPNIERGKAQSREAITSATSAQWKLDSDQAAKGYEIAAGVAQDPAVIRGDSKGSVEALMRAEEQMRAMKTPEDKIRVIMSPLYSIAAHKPETLRQTIDNIIRSGSGVSAQAGVINAPVSMVDTGGGIAPVQQQPGAQGGMRPGDVPITKGLPPTTEVFNPQTNAKQMIGPQPQQPLPQGGQPNPQEVELAGRSPQELAAIEAVRSGRVKSAEVPREQLGVVRPQNLQSGPALGQATTEEGKANIVKDHFQQATANVASSALLEGIAQNIKTFAQRAIVGTEQEKLAFVNGLLERLGISGASDLKTATDLMEKNMAQLAKNSPAATDAARVVNQLASPHPTMNEKAISEAADQIIGQVRMSRDIYKHFLPHALKGDNAAYLKKLGEFSDVSDARVWQFEALSPADRVSFVSAMKPEDRETFKKKIQQAEKMGLFK